ncbi:hypothetical protein ACWDBW_13475 [Streptomyces sp. NPDC001107]
MSPRHAHERTDRSPLSRRGKLAAAALLTGPGTAQAAPQQPAPVAATAPPLSSGHAPIVSTT